ncbi:MAG: hypothetical protein IJZ34_06165 [Lachnospiraceae bacterium]|nr:hypothetical protein [Lachnospiraceae bacterium]
MFAIALILTIVGFVYGAYANPYWKEIEGSEKYANGFVRALIGIPAWITVIGMFMKVTSVVITALLITAALLSIPFLRMRKDGIPDVKYTLLLLFASMGAYARIILAWTIMGIPVNIYAKRVAEVGSQNAAMEVMGRLGAEAERREKSPKREEAFDFGSFTAPEEPVRKEKVEVWRMNGMVRENLKVNSDNTMYYDPDDGEWKKIKK